MNFSAGKLLLRDQYKLIKQLDSNSELGSQSWIAEHMESAQDFIVKIWSFTSEQNGLQRALWDAELRKLYRISSSPGAEESILVIRDAGLDSDNSCYVMAMTSGGAFGFDALSEALLHRSSGNYPWLDVSDQKQRLLLWQGLSRIAQGINLLHIQGTLHRNINSENIYFHPDSGPDSFRLSGFEWSIRVGEKQLNVPPMGWSIPPEGENSGSFGYQPSTDWYGFGMLAARCMLNIEKSAQDRPRTRNKIVIEQIKRTNERYLSGPEKEFILHLIDRNPANRFVRSYDILTSLSDLISAFHATPATSEKPLLLTYNAFGCDALVEAATAAGFLPNSDNQSEGFNPNSILHCNRLSKFIQDDISEALLYYYNELNLILVGKNLTLKVTRWQDAARNFTWDAAFTPDVWSLSRTEGGNEIVELPRNAIAVRTIQEVRQRRQEIASSQPWTPYLPKKEKGDQLRANLVKFHDFIRCTNQIDLLLRDSELFEFIVTEYKQNKADLVEQVTIEEKPRARPPLKFIDSEGGLVSFLQREIETNKPYCDYVILASPDMGSLRFILDQNRIEPRDCFRIKSIDDKAVVLERQLGSYEMLPVPSQGGWLRTYGMFGQIELIRRRKEAIDRLTNHAYLLKSLHAPGQVYIDVGQYELPVSLPTEQVDESKQSIMQDVLRTRPVYTLQGPPGTGKTTMVAYLLRQIFQEDPVAQVIITAQAHSAVDVLRSKVREEAFKEVDSARLPLTVRLGRRSYDDQDWLEGSVEHEARRILKLSVERISSRSELSNIQKEWLGQAQDLLTDIETRYSQNISTEFVELVKRAANITYCTTSASDLEELARSTQSYDWSIIEEAGKCHGFDLALPMQAGHRWVLIGDQNQLPPYRMDDYKVAIENLEDVVMALQNLPQNGGGLLDRDWINRWQALDDNEKEEFKGFSKRWLPTFETIYEQCSIAPKGSHSPTKTLHESIGALAGLLSMQYRMHPTIGTLISNAYYDGEIVNRTIGDNNLPIERVSLSIEGPILLERVGVLWLDIPHATSPTSDAYEIGPIQGKPRYTNQLEAKVIKSFLSNLHIAGNHVEALRLAVLSPYNQQVSLLRSILERNFELPVSVIPKAELSTKQSDLDGKSTRLVHSVDSFQGNEADIIIVSLVRNNDGNGQRPLGFLDDPARMNVLLSRAQRLLILVGSWDFFWSQASLISPDDKTRKDHHLRIAMDQLKDWFEDGTAVKINSDQFFV